VGGGSFSLIWVRLLSLRFITVARFILISIIAYVCMLTIDKFIELSMHYFFDVDYSFIIIAVVSDIIIIANLSSINQV